MAFLTKPVWLTKFLGLFADNEYQNITEATFRTQFQDTADSVAFLSELNAKMVRGGLYPVPYTDSLGTIPAGFLILGMQAMARVGLSAADAAAAGIGNLADHPPVYFQLLRDPAGTINALLDENPATTATTPATWVQQDKEEESTYSFPAWVQEDHPYAAGDVFKYKFATGQTRLFEVRAAISTFINPTPTGLETDVYYAPFASLDANVSTALTGLLANLNTTDKSNLVAAINEIANMTTKPVFYFNIPAGTNLAEVHCGPEQAGNFRTMISTNLSHLVITEPASNSTYYSADPRTAPVIFNSANTKIYRFAFTLINPNLAATLTLRP